MKKFDLFGGRVVKTGVSIFLTAWICELLNWPPVFAVITAIVTLEPTVADSIKKGFVRFPASAIGSAYAVFFISIFGNSPLTYTLAAVLTIATCFRLKLHAGLLVATLTAVAMVEVIHSNYLISFFIRLGTTTVGLLVSTGVNMFVLPPDYTTDIIKNIQGISKKTGSAVEKVFRDILKDNHEHDVAEKEMIKQLDERIYQTETLIRFQKDESKFHPLVGSEKQQFSYAQDQLMNLRLINYHIDNLINTPLKTISWTKNEKEIILLAVKDLAESLQKPAYYNPEEHKQQLKQLTEIFWEDNESIIRKLGIRQSFGRCLSCTYAERNLDTISLLPKNNEKHPTNFIPELIVLYELLSIYNLVEKFYGK
ncbi:hypothetical protein CIL05_15220 [Virgibacillus profundi]|uniref:Aromatic acid exporter family protein n=1 Tax=Virgibacillus profundi TaxID=2024555 RepID=A0A2A2IBH9_9BACI|nr:aromatic acid exporter family protein [Virgibacillus profundi]PAV28644.1 hypothetical protein CIL05_15220 [Virgibacillus profundi]PXY52812.1 hypothetical protein CIT14_15350 [Virgibacillus profundi]